MNIAFLPCIGEINDEWDAPLVKLSGHHPVVVMVEPLLLRSQEDRVLAEPVVYVALVHLFLLLFSDGDQ